MLGYLVEDVGVVHELGVTSGQFDCAEKQGEAEEEERLAGTAIAFIVLSDFIVHGQRSPGLEA